MRKEATINGCLCKFVGATCLVCLARARNKRDGRVCKACKIGLLGAGKPEEHQPETDTCAQCKAATP